MTNYPAQVVVKVLYQEFPELAKLVDDKIREKLPEKTFHDTDLISEIVMDLCCMEGIEVESLNNRSGQHDLSIKRRVIFSTVLKLYQPELLKRLVNGLVSCKVSKVLKKHSKISRTTFSKDIRTSIHHYHLYKDFRDNVDSLYNKIIEKYGND